ncbi:hypothetical protein CFOL_v3_15429 [Cephalotus follicularis]|uniref:Uncharacterized protein n=1 Tax=Cephalotus follicularis TaxID=3775 RepID=A0A1Q3BVD2_CEPFO|nr:hypothetical protein CFOL_v3_15429 [Cephalotus follicularis]
MGNIIASFVSGLTKAIGNLFGSPLDFLAGKSCSSVCGPTWDLICYIDNFCVANLLKMVAVLVLLYIILLFFYLLHKVGIYKCVGHSLCKILWACMTSWFSIWKICCTFLWFKLTMVKKRNRIDRRDFDQELSTSEEEFNDDHKSFSYHVPRYRTMDMGMSPSHRWRDHRESLLRKSLRPRSYHVQVGIGRDSSIHGYRRNSIKHRRHVHDFRVTHTSKFVQKSRKYRGGIDGSRRWSRF